VIDCHDGVVSAMGGKSQASLHVDGKEIFSIQLNESGTLMRLRPLGAKKVP